VGDDGADPLIGAHFARVSDVVADHDGVVVKTLGDGVLATFRSAPRALGCAAAIQRAEARGHPATLWGNSARGRRRLSDDVRAERARGTDGRRRRRVALAMGRVTIRHVHPADFDGLREWFRHQVLERWRS
jgi:class 3 adenylate cyclase